MFIIVLGISVKKRTYLLLYFVFVNRKQWIFIVLYWTTAKSGIFLTVLVNWILTCLFWPIDYLYENRTLKTVLKSHVYNSVSLLLIICARQCTTVFKHVCLMSVCVSVVVPVEIEVDVFLVEQYFSRRTTCSCKSDERRWRWDVLPWWDEKK